MEHSYYKDKVSAYLDDALEVQEMELMRRHLEECAECRQLLEKFSNLNRKVEELSELKEADYFDKLAAKIDSKIAEGKSKVVQIEKQIASGWVWRISAVAASVLLVATVSYYQWTDHEKSLDEIAEITNRRPTQSVGFVVDSVAQAKPQQVPIPPKETDGEPVSLEDRGQKKDVATVAGESKVEAAPKKVVDVTGLPEGMLKFESERLTVIITDSAAKQKILEEKESQGDITEGYVADGEERVTAFADKLRQEAAPVGDIIIDEVEIDSAYNLLQVWRDKRDSLTAALKERNLTTSYKNLKSAVAVDLDRTDEFKKDSSLAFAWYQIGLLTIDSKEKKEAMEFLQAYKSRDRADSAVIRGYIKELGN